VPISPKTIPSAARPNAARPDRPTGSVESGCVGMLAFWLISRKGVGARTMLQAKRSTVHDTDRTAPARQGGYLRLKCWLARTWRLIARWSCSRALFRYCTGRCWQLRADRLIVKSAKRLEINPGFRHQGASAGARCRPGFCRRQLPRPT
jgi:hypothetical protein